MVEGNVPRVAGTMRTRAKEACVWGQRVVSLPRPPGGAVVAEHARKCGLHVRLAMVQFLKLSELECHIQSYSLRFDLAVYVE